MRISGRWVKGLIGGLPIAALVLWMAFPRPALACSCVRLSVEDQLEMQREMGADGLVFEGLARSVTEPAFARSSLTPVRYEFSLRRSWLNAASPSLVIETPMSSASCGASFEIGRVYLVFARRGEGAWATSLCDLNMPIDQAEEALALLGDGLPPVEGAGEVGDGGGWGLPLPLGIGLVLLGLVAFAIIEWDRQRRIRSFLAMDRGDGGEDEGV